MVSKRAVITFYDEHEPVDPGFGGGIGSPVYPGHGLPTPPVYPSHGLPGGGHISLLPVFPFDPTKPDNELPSGGTRPDNDLPAPGKKYVVKWLACQGLILVPDNSLPGTPAKPDHTLPSTPTPK